MTGIFKENNPINYFLLLGYGIFLKFALLHEGAVLQHSEMDGMLFTLLTKHIAQGSGRLLGVFCFLLLMWQAFSINRIANSFRLLPTDNFLPGMTFLLLGSGSPGWMHLSAPLLSATLLISLLSGLCRLHTHPAPAALIFNSSMLLGLSVFLYYPNVVLLIFLLVAVAISRPFMLREWVMAVIGLLVPFYLIWSFLFLNDGLAALSMPDLKLNVPIWQKDPYHIAWLGLLFLGLLISVFMLRNNRLKMLMQTRRCWTICAIFLLLTLFIPWLDAISFQKQLPLLILPASIMLSPVFFYPAKRWFPLLLHWSLFLLACYFNFNN